PSSVLAGLYMQGVAALSAIGLASTVQDADQIPEDRTHDQLLTVEEAAERLKVPREWVYRRAKRLGLPVPLDRGTLRIFSIALDAFIKGKMIAINSSRRRKSLDSSDRLIAR